MIVVNFSHPLTAAQRTQIEAATGSPITDVAGGMLQVDDGAPLEDQVRAAVDAVGLSAGDWQTEPLVVVLPGLAIAAGVLLAELHGRCGYFPACARFRPVPGAVPIRFELAEVVDLQAIRAGARERRVNA